MKILLYIPCRKGSKRFPNKNTANFGDFCLAERTFIQAKELLKRKYVDKIVLTTDDSQILRLVQKYPIDRIVRPSKLASSEARVEDEVIRILNKKEYQEVGVCVQLLVTSPLRTVKDVIKAIKIFRKNDLDALASVDEQYKPNGAIMIFRKDMLIWLHNRLLEEEWFKKDKTSVSYSMYPKTMGLYVMPNRRSIDVNTWWELSIASAIKNKKVFR